ncbi:MAG: molybdenum ABC transporter ATP-binding protein [Burkholderiaceae bacterium]|nr:molybdenum ABC transporter ATP-binding protein [Burkholderiaceae bacterium]
MKNAICARLNVHHSGYALQADLEFPAQGISAIFGPSGAGKTTILRAIAGLERSYAHYVSLDGDIWQDEAQGIFVPTYRRPLGFVFQDVGLFPHLDVRRNLEYGMRRVPQQSRRISLDDAVELLGIGHMMERKPETLSGGERQRVGIARALATSPRVLLLDEPLAALDLARKQEVLPFLERLNHQLKIPMLYVSHALDEVARLADHLVLLDGGKVQASGATARLLTQLDLPLAQGDTAAAIIEGQVIRREAEFRLACVEFPGGQIFLLNETADLGQHVRLRVQARDVSLTLAAHADTSILNILAATVVDLVEDSSGQVMVGLDVGSTRILSRITKKSAVGMGLTPGKAVFAQVKGVAVLE